MNRFHLLEHTADTGIEALADTREGLVGQAGLGLRWLLYGHTEAASSHSEEITAEGNSAEETLVNWLNELLFVMTEKQFIPAYFAVRSFTDQHIVATVTGDKAAPGKRRMLREVKAATYHQARVVNEKARWKAVVYIDL